MKEAISESSGASKTFILTDVRLFEYLRDSLVCLRRRQEGDVSKTGDSADIQVHRYSMENLFEIATIHRGSMLLDEFLKPSKRNFDEEYIMQKKIRGQFALDVIGILNRLNILYCSNKGMPEIGYKIKKYLGITDFKSLGLVSKRINSSLIEFSNRPKILEISLREKKFEFALELFQKFRSLDPTMEFDIIAIYDNDHKFNVGSALTSSCYYGDIALFQHLVDSHLDLSVESNAALRLASFMGHFKIVCKLLEDPRVGARADDNCAIRSASLNGHINVVCRLLEDPRVDPSADSNFSIVIASQKGHFEIVCKLLEDPRVDPSADSNFSIIIASQNGHFDVVCRLLEDSRVNPKVRNNYAIKSAKRNGHLDIVNRLFLDARV